MRFDTRTRKPQLYSLLALAGITAAVIAFLAAIRIPHFWTVTTIIIAIFFLLVIIVMFVAFLRQLGYNPYSYNTIFYIGFAMFFLCLFVVQVILSICLILVPKMANFDQILRVLLESAEIYMMVTFPLVLLYSITLIISNITLIKHEGFKFANLFAIFLAILLVGGMLLVNWSHFWKNDSRSDVLVSTLVCTLLAASYLYFESLLIGIIIGLGITGKYEPDKDIDFLLILGCDVQEDGRPTPVLKARIDRAITFYRRQKEETGKDLIFIPTGGKGTETRPSECACITQYLLEQGIPENLIIGEDKATTTVENMKFSKEIINKIKPDGKVIFATSRFHVFRSGLYARREKIKAVGIGANTSWYYWPNAAIRELGVLLVTHKWKQTLIYLGILAVFTALALLVVL